MKTIGLTGGIACGKSTVAGLLRDWGVPVVDADQVSRTVVAPDSPGLAAIAHAFGSQLIGADGALRRDLLGKIVMADPDARRRLEAITHPRIAEEIATQLGIWAQQGHPVAVVEAALMVETDSFRRYDGVLLVRCSPATQLARLLARQGWDQARASQWIGAQLSLDDKEARLQDAAAQGGPALAVVDNDGGPTALPDLVARAWAELGRAAGF